MIEEQDGSAKAHGDGVKVIRPGGRSVSAFDDISSKAVDVLLRKLIARLDAEAARRKGVLRAQGEILHTLARALEAVEGKPDKLEGT